MLTKGEDSLNMPSNWRTRQVVVVLVVVVVACVCARCVVVCGGVCVKATIVKLAVFILRRRLNPKTPAWFSFSVRILFADTRSHSHFFSVISLRRTCDALRTLQHFHGSTSGNQTLTCFACDWLQLPLPRRDFLCTLLVPRRWVGIIPTA